MSPCTPTTSPSKFSQNLLTLVLLFLLSACCKGKFDKIGNGSGSKPATGNSPASAPDVENFAGKYMSNYGPCNMEQTGTSVSGSCPGRGTTFQCTVSGKTINCTWKEGGAVGKSVATKQADGKVLGTYGSGSSSTNGGPWNFVPQ